MKILFKLLMLISCGLVFTACLDEDNLSDVVYHYRAIDDVQIDSIYPVGQVTEIKTYFHKSNSCENFFDYEYYAFDNERKVYLITYRIEDTPCTQEASMDSAVLKFLPQRDGTYKFKFWSGTDENGDDMYLIREIIIPNPH
ncbi:MAG: hypothetical protein WDA08_07315 [Weeksellaceae bacterium]